MYKILDKLNSNQIVLDFCSGRGSFTSGDYPFQTVRVDRETAGATIGLSFVQADANTLPFRSQCFDAVIANHALEHISPLKPALQELGRVVKKTGWAYVAVPDARTFSDRLYRKLFRNRGGHVNLFDCADRLARMLEWYLGLEHLATVPLFGSYSYLNRENYRRCHGKRAQLKAIPLGEETLLRLNAALAYADDWFNLGFSRYGWALYFGHRGVLQPIATYRNVCVRCGSGIRVGSDAGRRQRVLGLSRINCPVCGGSAIDRSSLMD